MMLANNFVRFWTTRPLHLLGVKLLSNTKTKQKPWIASKGPKCWKTSIIEPLHNRTYNDMCKQWRLRSVCRSVQFNQSLLIACAFYSIRAIKRGINENSCHTVCMYRLIWVFASYTALTHFIVTQFQKTNLILSFCKEGNWCAEK